VKGLLSTEIIHFSFSTGRCRSSRYRSRHSALPHSRVTQRHDVAGAQSPRRRDLEDTSAARSETPRANCGQRLPPRSSGSSPRFTEAPGASREEFLQSLRMGALVWTPHGKRAQRGARLTEILRRSWTVFPVAGGQGRSALCGRGRAGLAFYRSRSTSSSHRCRAALDKRGEARRVADSPAANGRLGAFRHADVAPTSAAVPVTNHSHEQGGASRGDQARLMCAVGHDTRGRWNAIRLRHWRVGSVTLSMTQPDIEASEPRRSLKYRPDRAVSAKAWRPRCQRRDQMAVIASREALAERASHLVQPQPPSSDCLGSALPNLHAPQNGSRMRRRGRRRGRSTKILTIFKNAERRRAAVSGIEGEKASRDAVGVSSERSRSATRRCDCLRPIDAAMTGRAMGCAAGRSAGSMRFGCRTSRAGVMPEAQRHEPRRSGRDASCFERLTHAGRWRAIYAGNGG